MSDISAGSGVKTRNPVRRLGENRPFLFVLAVVLFLGVLWSYLFITASTHRTLDQRTHDVAAQLKCPVCQNESVADSPSIISQQMRSVIRQQLQAGRSEQQVVQYFEDRYGPQIILSPPWQGFSLLIWLVPIALFLAGLGTLFFIVRDWRQGAPMHDAALDERNENRGVSEEDAEMVQYRQQLEQELAAEDVLFKKTSVGEMGVEKTDVTKLGVIPVAPTGER